MSLEKKRGKTARLPPSRNRCNRCRDHCPSHHAVAVRFWIPHRSRPGGRWKTERICLECAIEPDVFDLAADKISARVYGFDNYGSLRARVTIRNPLGYGPSPLRTVCEILASMPPRACVRILAAQKRQSDRELR